jgi:hypothetical protein
MWSYVLPPGWRSKSDTSIADVAVFQYVSSNEGALSAREKLGVTLVEVGFERLLADPAEEIARVLDACRLTPSSEVMNVVGGISDLHAGSITPPQAEKWKRRANDVLRVLPQAESTMSRLGYEKQIG